MKEIQAALLGGLIAAAIGVGAQYWIVYDKIEKPKMALEQSKASIEALKQALALAPIATSTCNTKKVDAWSWIVNCTTKTSSTYPIWVNITTASISLNTDRNEKIYEENKGFTLSFPNNKKSYRAPPISEGNLWFYINFDKNIYPSGMTREDLVTRVSIEYLALDSSKKIIAETFPETVNIIKEISENRENIYSSLKQP